MKDVVKELRHWERAFKADYENGDSRSLPTEANILRMLIYSVMMDFLDDALDDPDFEDASTSSGNPSAPFPLDNYVVEWIDKTFGKDELAEEYVSTAVPVG